MTIKQPFEQLSTPVKQALWDWPVRLCHWLMVVLVAACWWTAENHEIVFHSYFGYGLLGVLVFRIYWGFAGSSTARFTQFVRKPVVVLAYVKTLTQRSTPSSTGHNPLGGYSVIALLLLMLVQIGLGLYAIDVDGFDGGPFSDYLSFKASRLCAELHGLLFNLLLGVIALHILAVFYYLLWRRQNLIGAMVHGKTRAALAQPVQLASRPRLVAGLVLAAALVWLVINFSELL